MTLSAVKEAGCIKKDYENADAKTAKDRGQQ